MFILFSSCLLVHTQSHPSIPSSLYILHKQFTKSNACRNVIINRSDKFIDILYKNVSAKGEKAKQATQSSKTWYHMAMKLVKQQTKLGIEVEIELGLKVLEKSIEDRRGIRNALKALLLT
jgi:hypothetical protein